MTVELQDSCAQAVAAATYMGDGDLNTFEQCMEVMVGLSEETLWSVVQTAVGTGACERGCVRAARVLFACICAGCAPHFPHSIGGGVFESLLLQEAWMATVSSAWFSTWRRRGRGPV
jgi:hypothetical protein